MAPNKTSGTVMHTDERPPRYASDAERLAYDVRDELIRLAPSSTHTVSWDGGGHIKMESRFPRPVWRK